MSTLRDCCAIVLAAGKGTRMGTPKALMAIDGGPWWKWQRERLRDIGIESAWVVSPAVESAMGADRADVRLIRGDPDAPMFASIAAGVGGVWAPTFPRGVFILPVDVPAPAPPTWRALAASDDAAVPRWNGKRGHPVFLSRACVERIGLIGAASRGETESRRLDQLIAPFEREVEVRDADVLVNLNTPADVARWLATREGTAA